MLVLSRKPGEKILIGEDIVVTITVIGTGAVRVGIEAPRHLRIDRAEVAEARAAEIAEGLKDFVLERTDAKGKR